MTTQLISLEKEFDASSQVLQLNEKSYAKAGFKKASKAIAAARLGYRFCNKNQIQKWVDQAAAKEGKIVSGRQPFRRQWGLMAALSGEMERSNEVAGATIRKGQDQFRISINQMPVEEYQGIPPQNVADAVAKAKDDKCFSKITILYPKCTKIIEDPIVVGEITGLPNVFFFIAGWLHDLFSFDEKGDEDEDFEEMRGTTFTSARFDESSALSLIQMERIMREVARSEEQSRERQRILEARLDARVRPGMRPMIVDENRQVAYDPSMAIDFIETRRKMERDRDVNGIW